MASYTYECANHKRPIKREVRHYMKDDPVVNCRACGKPMQKLPPQRHAAVLKSGGLNYNPWDAVFHRFLDPGWRNYRHNYNKNKRKKDERQARAQRQKTLEERERAPKVIPIRRSFKDG